MVRRRHRRARSRRRTRRNPGGLSLVLIGAGVLGAGGIAFLLGRKPPLLTSTNGVQFASSSPQFSGTSIDDANFGGIIASDMLTVDVARAQFNDPGVHDGNAIFQAVAAPNLSTHTILAVSKDPRITDATPRAIPQAAITGIAPQP